MPYKETTIDEFLAIATESLIGRSKKKSVNDLLANAKKVLTKKLKTNDDCDEYTNQLRIETTKFDDCLKTLNATKAAYDAGKITPRDFNAETKKAITVINTSCKTLKCKLEDIVDDKSSVTASDIADFKAYTTGLIDITKQIKSNLSPASESTFAAMESELFDLAYGEKDALAVYNSPEFNNEVNDLTDKYRFDDTTFADSILFN